jgi:hypothetical protein
MPTGRARRGVIGGFGRAIRVVAPGFAREYRLRRQIAFLMQQDPRMLADIGLTHADVARTVRWGREG